MLTANAFQLLDEENEDPQAILEASKVIAEKAEEKKKAISKEKPTAAAKPGSGAAARLGQSAAPNGADQGPGDSSQRGRGGRFGDRGRGRGGRRGGYGGRDGGGGDLPDESYNAESAPTSVRGGRPGRGEGRAPRGAHIPRGGGHREGQSTRRTYDRQDNTGRGAEREKRGGAGHGNWGKEGEEAAEVEEDKPIEQERAEIVKDLQTPEEPVAATETVEAQPQEEEEKEMTLEEYEALQAEKRATSTLNKKNEAKNKPDVSQFKGMKAYEGKPEEDESDALELTNKKQLGRSKVASERIRKEKETVATSFRIGEEASRGGGRGRGRGRGEGRFGGDRFGGEGGGRFGGDRFGGEGGGRFGDREERPQRSYEDRPPRGDGPGRGFGSSFGGVRGGRGRGNGPAPELTDDSAFPSLGGK